MKHINVITVLAALTILSSCGHAPTSADEIEKHVQKEVQKAIEQKQLELSVAETGYIEKDNAEYETYVPTIKFNTKNNSPLFYNGDYEIKVEFINVNNEVFSVHAVTVHDKALEAMRPFETIKTTILSHIKLPTKSLIGYQQFYAKIYINDVEFSRVAIANKVIGEN